MIDFHSHALPGIDDGARDCCKSAEMLNNSKLAGVELVVLTPHFYCRHSITEFTERRSFALAELQSYCEERAIELPKLKLGAEVAFSYELFAHKDLKRLCIEGTSTMLLELPFTCWNSWMFEKIFELEASHGINVVIAHGERYLKSPKELTRLSRIFEMNIPIQLNADSFFMLSKKRIVSKLLEKEHTYILGSDMHNTTTRKTMLAKCSRNIEKKYGEEFLRRLEVNALNLLEMS